MQVNLTGNVIIRHQSVPECQWCDKAKEYLQKAVQLMPSDPIVNDHYADTLWMTGEKIQARYYWNYVLKLEKTEDEQKKLSKIN